MGTRKSVARFPDGTYVINRFRIEGEYTYEIGVVADRLAYGVWYADRLINANWGCSPVFDVAIAPGTPDHDRVLAFVTAAQLGAEPCMEIFGALCP